MTDVNGNVNDTHCNRGHHSPTESVVHVGRSRSAVGHLSHSILSVIGVGVKAVIGHVPKHVVSNAAGDVVVRVEKILRLWASYGAVLLPAIPKTVVCSLRYLPPAEFARRAMEMTA